MSMRKRRWRYLLAAILVIGAGEGRADESLFGYVTGGDVLPKGAAEAYVWMTDRRDKGKGTYGAQDYRLELEYGISDAWTGSLYLNWRSHEIRGAAPLDENGAAEYPDLDRQFGFQGVQASFKHMLLSPVKDSFGLSLYFEPGYSRIFKISGERQKELSLETKVILEKHFFDDQLIWTSNVTPEIEFRKFEAGEVWESELALEVTSGVSYRFAPNWFGALEARYHSEYPDWPDAGTREHYAVFLGPSLHYGAKRWWFTLTYLPQVVGRPVAAERSDDLHFSEHERREVRLKAGYNF